MAEGDSLVRKGCQISHVNKEHKFQTVCLFHETHMHTYLFIYVFFLQDTHVSKTFIEWFIQNDTNACTHRFCSQLYSTL